MGLAWRHYRALLGVEERPKRDFYEIEAIFTSRYKLHLPSEAELREEVRREVRVFREILPD